MTEANINDELKTKRRRRRNFELLLIAALLYLPLFLALWVTLSMRYPSPVRFDLEAGLLSQVIVSLAIIAFTIPAIFQGSERQKIAALILLLPAMGTGFWGLLALLPIMAR